MVLDGRVGASCVGDLRADSLHADVFTAVMNVIFLMLMQYWYWYTRD